MPKISEECDEGVDAIVEETETIKSNAGDDRTVEVMSNNAVRVKDIGELIENNVSSSTGVEAESNDMPIGESVNGVKRKLPDWMLSQVQSTSKDADTLGEEAASISSCSSSKKCKLSRYDEWKLYRLETLELPVTASLAAPIDEQEILYRLEREVNAVAELNQNTTDDSAVVDIKKEEETKANSKPIIKNEPITIKTEENDLDTVTTSTQPSSTCGTSTRPPFDVNIAIKVEKANARSTRESCRFGIRCYRRSHIHRAELAHPGDHDYKRPQYTPPPPGTPSCPYGPVCYRRNPSHFQQYSHPSHYYDKLRQQQQSSSLSDSNDSDMDEYDFDDPFICPDSDDDSYNPSDNDSEHDDDDDADYDDCDMAEE